MSNLHTDTVLGIKVHTTLDMKDVLNMVETLLFDGKSGHYICTTNPEFVIDAQSDPQFAQIINKADLSLPDGSGVLFATKYNELVRQLDRKDSLFIVKALFAGLKVGLRGLAEPSYVGNKITGVSLVEEIAKLSAQKGYSIYLLGGWPKDRFGRRLKDCEDLATKTADMLRKKYPQVNIIGSSSQFGRGEEDDEATILAIKKDMKKANVKVLNFLLVAYNHIHQEKWIVRNAKKIPVSVSVGVGGTFDYLSGYIRPSTDKISKNNLEWLDRLIRQPWRFDRISKAFPTFPIKVFLESLKN